MKAGTGGIPDWSAKKMIIRAVLGGFTDADIVDMVIGDEDPELAHRIKVNFRKWGTSTPRSKESQQFFEGLVRNLGCPPGTTAFDIVNSPLDQFIEHLHADDRSRALAVREETSIANGAPELRASASVVAGGYPLNLDGWPSSFRPVMVPVSGRIETISDGIRQGRVNEKHYYLTPEAANTWSNLVNAEHYPTYDQCKSSLRLLSESVEWQAALQEKPITAAVMLCGGGSPSKDLIIVKSLLNQIIEGDPPIDYVILDISPYMLLSSIWWLNQPLKTLPGGSRVRLLPVCGDVIQMVDRRVLHQNGGRTVFAITGGTLGNLSEQQFFQSLKRVEAPDDLLIIGVDTLPDENEGVEERLVGTYSHREMQCFVAPAIHALIRDFGLPENSSKAFGEVKVEVRHAQRASSDVPNSASVTLSFELNGEEVTLLSSTRYREQDLATFAESHGWTQLCAIASPSSRFKQFLFKKEP